MDVILKLFDNRVEMFIFDNGIGCINIKDGNGLCGIKKRVFSVNGTLNISSRLNEGFQIIIKIPLID